jgi:hypothetical protein
MSILPAAHDAVPCSRLRGSRHGLAEPIVEPVKQMSANGGFPEPPPGPSRLVAARHDSCGTETRIRLPRPLPAQVVRRVVCSGCSQPFAVAAVVDLGVVGDPPALDAGPRGRLPSLPKPGRLWRWARVPLAAGAVLVVLALVRGGEEAPQPRAAGAPAAAAVQKAPPGGALVVHESTFTLALPPGWKRTRARDGATFAARSSDRTGEVTLWVERDPGLSFAEFEARSIARVKELTGAPPQVERKRGPSPERSSFTITAAAPEGAPRYIALGRAAGPYRYYLATTLKPDAPPAIATGAEMIRNSLVPEGAQ